jgi:hypothetical protein
MRSWNHGQSRMANSVILMARTTGSSLALDKLLRADGSIVFNDRDALIGAPLLNSACE